MWRFNPPISTPQQPFPACQTTTTTIATTAAGIAETAMEKSLPKTHLVKPSDTQNMATLRNDPLKNHVKLPLPGATNTNDADRHPTARGAIPSTPTATETVETTKVVQNREIHRERGARGASPGARRPNTSAVTAVTEAERRENAAQPGPSPEKALK